MLNSYNNQQTTPVQRNLFQVPKSTGVDKLIFAAMMNEAYGAPLQQQTGPTPCPNPNYLPSGRGLGYLPNSARAPQYSTTSQIPTPSNKSELELYRLLERANLLNYFGTFLNFGGDDVQQLCDADEEEFLEIMSLVGMTQKPLHVRRLQKALIEWKEAKELENTFRRPQPTNSYPYYTGSASGNNNNSKIISNDSFSSNRQVASTTSFVESPLSNPPSVSSRSSELHYALPQELVGAPKRIRLMDDLHNKPLLEPSPYREKARSHLTKNFDNSLFNRTENRCLMASSPKPRQSSIIKEDRDEEDDDNIEGDDQDNDDVERDEDGDDRDDGKLIDIIDSSHSDLEVDESVTNATCGSLPSDTKKYSQNKYGRYKASLETAKSFEKHPKV